jgi:taurine-pyruvate aminotransferase
VIGDVRGKGLFVGAELVSDRFDASPMDEKHGAGCRGRLHGERRHHRGHQPVGAGLQQHAVLQPGALIATADDIDRITDSVDQALTRVFA